MSDERTADRPEPERADGSAEAPDSDPAKANEPDPELDVIQPAAD